MDQGHRRLGDGAYCCDGREADCGTWALHTRAGFVLLPLLTLDSSTTVIWAAPMTNGVEKRRIVVCLPTRICSVSPFFVLSLGACWLVLSLLRDKSQPNRVRHFLARGPCLPSACRFW